MKLASQHASFIYNFFTLPITKTFSFKQNRLFFTASALSQGIVADGY